ncbi:MAG TPA: urea ABC transporter permease subunit UrtB [Steroidobacteraceae bacterium]
MQESRLLFSAEQHKVYIREATGALLDAAAGREAGAAPTDLKPVRLNNRIRRSIEAAVGGLTLLAADPSRRLDAARAVFKSRDATLLAPLEAAIAKETNTRIKRVLVEARAAIQLFLPNAKEADKIEAVGILRERGDQEALGLLSTLPADSPATVISTARDAIASIQRQLAIWNAVQNAWYGLSLGSVLLLAAIGLAITFGVMGVINMAHGEMVMLGAYVTFVVQEIIRMKAPGLFDYSLFIAIPLAFVVAGLIGIVIERGIIRFLYGRPLETLLATWGLSLILQQMVRTTFGASNREVGNPSWMSGGFEIGQMTITYNRMWIIVFTILVFLALLALLRFTRLGLEMRAVTQNRAMAAAMGIRTSRIDALTFGLGSGIAGIAGVALSQIDNVSPNLGQSYIIDSFMVVVFGGVGNLWGTLVGALSLGMANKFLEPFAGAVLAKIAILVLIILFIQKRPRGLFALKGRAVEA